MGLPYKGEKLGSKILMYSSKSVTYLKKHHLSPIGLHVRQNVTVIEKAKNISIPANNQGAEGFFCNEKHNVRDLALHTSEPGTYF